MKRLAMLVVGVALIGSIGLAAVLALGDGSAPAEQPPLLSPPAATSDASPDPAADMWPPLRYGPAQTASPLAGSSQHHLWFHDGAWWGVFLAGETSDHRIFLFDAEAGSWVPTTVVVDERSNAHMDVLWDGGALTVASAGTQPSERHALRITRFSYVAESRTYLRDADFPVAITDVGVEGVTLTRSSDGRLWVAYRAGTRLELNHSLDSDLSWRGPFVPEQAGGPVAEAAIAAMGDHVAMVWTTPDDDAVYLATHDVTGAPDRWLSGPAAPVPGLRLGDNDLAVAVDPSPGDVKLLIGVRIGLDDAESRPRLDPQVVVIEAAIGEEPRVHLFGRIRDQYGAPHLVVDASTRQLFVLAPVPRAGGTIYYKRASLDGIDFPAGLGMPLITGSADHPQVRNLTSTKQAIDQESGLLVAGTDQTTGVYAFGSLGLREGPAIGGPGQVANPILNQTFDGLPVGSPITGWELSGEPAPAFAIAILTGADGSARLSTEGSAGRACARLGGISDGQLRVEADGLYNIPTEDELHLLQVRGDAGEAASVRLREGQLVYPDGDRRVASDRVLAPGRWYRSTLTLDVEARTYAIEVSDLVSGTTLLSEDGLAWRIAGSSSLNRACVEVPAEAGLDLYLNNVLITLEE